MATSQTFIAHKLITVDRDQDPFVIEDFGTTSQTPNRFDRFIIKIEENESKNTITYLVLLTEAVIS